MPNNNKSNFHWKFEPDIGCEIDRTQNRKHIANFCKSHFPEQWKIIERTKTNLVLMGNGTHAALYIKPMSLMVVYRSPKPTRAVASATASLNLMTAMWGQATKLINLTIQEKGEANE